jgi:GNAT superfamily N-acetyltransferase
MSEVSRSEELVPVPVSPTYTGLTRLSRMVSSGVASVRQTGDRFGTLAAARYMLIRVLNRVILADSWIIAVRDRDDLIPPDSAMSARFSCRLATRDDLEVMRADPRLVITERKLTALEAGDLCLLTCVDGQVAGYTWCRREGLFGIVPGLRFSIPHQFFYGYDALTLPEFRGLGLQAFRMYQWFSNDALADKAGEIGFVRATNFPMRHALARNGTRTVGSVWALGTRHHFVAHLSPSLRGLGMRRL